MISEGEAPDARGLRSPAILSRLWIFMVVGLVLRIALVFVPSAHTDVLTFRQWGKAAADHGTTRVWSGGGCNYMPVYPAILCVATKAYRAATGGEGDALPAWALKAMPVVGDLLTALALFLLLRRMTGEPIASAIAGVHFVNPAILIDSAGWGQVDVFHSLLVMASLAFAHWGRTRHDAWHHAAWMAFTLAVLFKLQAIVFGPLLLAVSVPGRKPGAVIVSAVAALFVSAAALAPLLLSGEFGSFADVAVLGATSRYGQLTLKAFNLWWLLPCGVLDRARDVDVVVAGISYRAVGLLLFGLAYAWALRCLWRAGRTIRADELFLAGGFVAVAFFVLCTQMHDRYIYPAIPLLAVAAAFRVGWVFYGLFSFTAAANLFLSLARVASPAPVGEGFGSWLVPAGTKCVALVNVGGLAVLALALGRRTGAAAANAPARLRRLSIPFLVSSALATLFFLVFGLGVGSGKVGRLLLPGRSLARNRNETMPGAFSIRNGGDCSVRIEGFEGRKQEGSVVIDLTVGAGQSGTIDMTESKPKSVRITAGKEGDSGASLAFRALNRGERPAGPNRRRARPSGR
jgi:hypothetical protein